MTPGQRALQWKICQCGKYFDTERYFNKHQKKHFNLLKRRMEYHSTRNGFYCLVCGEKGTLYGDIRNLKKHYLKEEQLGHDLDEMVRAGIDVEVFFQLDPEMLEACIEARENNFPELCQKFKAQIQEAFKRIKYLRARGF